MQFYITDIGNKMILLGYPWLSTFKPKFHWGSATIDEHILPIIISSINPTVERMIIAGTMTEHVKNDIMQQLEEQCMIRMIAMDLAIQAKQETKRAEIPQEYGKFSKLFSEEAS